MQGKEWESTTNCILEDTTAPFESCRSTDTNLLLASVTKWEDMGCTPGTTPEYLSLLQTHKMQKPSVSQGLYPILLLALLALTASAYTSLGVSKDSNPRPQLLKCQSTTQPHQLRCHVCLEFRRSCHVLCSLNLCCLQCPLPDYPLLVPTLMN